MALSANRLELLRIAESVANEKLIDLEIVIEAMESAIGKAARDSYGADTDVRASIDPTTGEASFSRVMTVVEEVENPSAQLTLESARSRREDAQIGDEFIEALPPVDFGRISALSAKQVMFQRIREAERERQYEEFKDRIGEIVSGVVKRIEHGNVMVELNRAEAIIRREELIPREVFRYGDRVRGYVYDVRREMRGPQIFLSRSKKEFMSKLFAQEVPEIYEGIVEIKGVARDPGSRAKIAVVSRESSIDPVGACVGMRGSRVQSVVGELQGEKIDIIPWFEDPATFIVNGLQPAKVSKVIVDDDGNRIEAIVPESELSLAIGRHGQNVRLASQLTGWHIDIMTEQEESERRQKDFQNRSELFMEALNVDELVAQLLASEDFVSVEDVAYAEPEEISAIEGFDDDTTAEIKSRAQEHLDALEAQRRSKIDALGVSQRLREVEGMTSEMMVALGQDGALKLEDLADFATDDLSGWHARNSDGGRTFHPGIFSELGVSRKICEHLILQARLILGQIEAQEPEEEADEGATVPEDLEGGAAVTDGDATVPEVLDGGSPDGESLDVKDALGLEDRGTATVDGVNPDGAGPSGSEPAPDIAIETVSDDVAQAKADAPKGR